MLRQPLYKTGALHLLLGEFCKVAYKLLQQTHGSGTQDIAGINMMLQDNIHTFNLPKREKTDTMTAVAQHHAADPVRQAHCV